MAYFHTTVLDNQIKVLPTVDTASGSVATFDTDLTENLVEVKCQIVASQSGSGTPSPSNPRPITTYTSLNLSHSGSDTSNSTVYNIPFGQTVANGVLDVTTGKLRVTHGVYNLTGSCLEASWYNADIDRNSIGFYIYPTQYVNNTGYPFPIEGGGIFDYCQTGNVYNNDNAWTANFLFVSGVPSRFEIRLPKSVLSDISSGINALNSARDYLNNNPLQTMYKITPYSIQLDSTQLTALLNENNIWCDTGDTEVKYLLTVGKKIS